MKTHLLQEDYTLPLSHSTKQLRDQQVTRNESSQFSASDSNDPTTRRTLCEKHNKDLINSSLFKTDVYLNLPHEKQPLSESGPVTTTHASDNQYLRTPLRRFTQGVPDALRRNIRKLTLLAPFQTPPEYGAKTIGPFGSFVYLVNQIFGAGILALPYVMKVSGWLPCFFANCFVSTVAMFGTLMILRVMTMIKGNQNFEKRVEYIPTVEYFLGRRYRFWTELCFYISVQSLNIMSIVIVAQSIDYLLLSIFGKTFAFLIKPYPFSISFKTFFTHTETNIIYSSSDTFTFGFTLGYILNACICIPLSSQSIDENMKIQYISFAFLMGSILQVTTSAFFRILKTSRPDLVASFFYPFSFVWKAIQEKEFSLLVYLSQYANGPIQSAVNQFFQTKKTSLDENDSLNKLKSFFFLDNPLKNLDNPLLQTTVKPPKMFGMFQYGQLFSTFIASYSYVNVIPSWANEMTPGVKVTKTVAYSTFFTSLTYYVFGYILAYSFPLVSSDNIFNEILQREKSLSFLTKCSIYIFNLLTVLPGIVVYSIATRYNLLNSGFATPYQSFFLSCVTPFFFAWLLANDDYFSVVLQVLVVNFIIPLILYITACGTQRMAKRNPTQAYLCQNRKNSSMSKGNPYILPEVSSQLIQYLKSLPFEEIDADLLPLLDRSSNNSSNSLELKKEKSSMFFFSDTSSSSSSESDATFCQYHDALTLSCLDKTINSENKQVHHYIDILKSNLPKQPLINILKKIKTFTTFRNIEREKCSSSLEIAQNCLSVPSHSQDSLKRRYTWPFKLHLKIHENSNLHQSPHVSSLNTSLHRSFSETHIQSFDHFKRCKSKTLQQHRKPLTKSLTIIPLTRKWFYDRKACQTGKRLRHFQQKTTTQQKTNSCNQQKSCNLLPSHSNSSLSLRSTEIVPSHEQILPRDSLPTQFNKLGLQQELPLPIQQNTLSTSNSILNNKKQEDCVANFRQEPVKHLKKNVHEKDKFEASKDRLPSGTESPVNEHYEIRVSNANETFSSFSSDLKEKKSQQQFSNALPTQTTSLNMLKLIVPIQGAEDAYECDEIPNTDELKPIRIHVFPRGILRTHHITTARILLISLVIFSILSIGSQIIINVLHSNQN